MRKLSASERDKRVAEALEDGANEQWQTVIRGSYQVASNNVCDCPRLAVRPKVFLLDERCRTWMPNYALRSARKFARCNSVWD